MKTNQKTIAVIGGGVIGQSWATLFASQGDNVNIYEPNEETQKTLKSNVLNQLQNMPEAVSLAEATANIHVFNTIEETVKGAYAVQESGPERADIKQNIFLEIEKHAPKDALIMSSSSGIVPSVSSKLMKDPNRLVVGHPFNPPHIMPLVEVLAIDGTDTKYIDRILKFYVGFNRVPVQLEKEIPGFVANRLQTVVILEAVNLINKGVVGVKELDTIMKNSLGIRWASIGPILTGVFGGGNGGIQHILEHILNPLINSMEMQPIDNETIQMLQQETDVVYPKVSRRVLAQQRDDLQRAIIKLQQYQKIE